MYFWSNVSLQGRKQNYAIILNITNYPSQNPNYKKYGTSEIENLLLIFLDRAVSHTNIPNATKRRIIVTLLIRIKNKAPGFHTTAMPCILILSALVKPE